MHVSLINCRYRDCVFVCVSVLQESPGSSPAEEEGGGGRQREPVLFTFADAVVDGAGSGHGDNADERDGRAVREAEEGREADGQAQLCFVYGSLMSSLHNHHHLAGTCTAT